MYIIYKCTNKVNGKVYIGCTSEKLQTRKRKHIQAAIKHWDGQIFHEAIRKYGEKAFEWSIIKNNIKRKKKAYQIETILIKRHKRHSYNMIIKHGHLDGRLNGMYGRVGKVEQLSKKIICIETNLLYNSISECSRKMKLCRKNVSRACNEQGSAGGYHFKFILKGDK